MFLDNSGFSDISFTNYPIGKRWIRAFPKDICAYVNITKPSGIGKIIHSHYATLTSKLTASGISDQSPI